MNPTTDMPFPIFTYGTLRPGQHNARMLEGAAVPGHTPETATVTGYALYANRSATYPYLVPEAGSTVTGTLYVVRGNDRFMRVHQMELGAGYDTAYVDAVLPSGRAVKALAWEWRRGDWLGERIDSGDWCEWRASHEPDWSREFRNVTRS